MNAKSKKTANPLENYEAQIEQLEHIITALEQGELSLDQSLKEYEEGIKLIRSCQQALESAEQRVRILSNQDTQEEDLKPYHDEEDKQDAAASAQRSRGNNDSSGKVPKAPSVPRDPLDEIFDDAEIPF